MKTENRPKTQNHKMTNHLESMSQNLFHSWNVCIFTGHIRAKTLNYYKQLPRKSDRQVIPGKKRHIPRFKMANRQSKRNSEHIKSSIYLCQKMHPLMEYPSPITWHLGSWIKNNSLFYFKKQKEEEKENKKKTSNNFSFIEHVFL